MYKKASIVDERTFVEDGKPNAALQCDVEEFKAYFYESPEVRISQDKRYLFIKAKGFIVTKEAERHEGFLINTYDRKEKDMLPPFRYP